MSSIAENVLINGTTLKVDVLLLVEVELQLVDAKLVELLEVVDDDDELELLLELVELDFDVVEEEEETEERLMEAEELMVLEEVVEVLDFGAERRAYAPIPATATTTTMIKATAIGASPPLF